MKPISATHLSKFLLRRERLLRENKSYLKASIKTLKESVSEFVCTSSLFPRYNCLWRGKYGVVCH